MNGDLDVTGAKLRCNQPETGVVRCWFDQTNDDSTIKNEDISDCSAQIDMGWKDHRLIGDYLQDKRGQASKNGHSTSDTLVEYQALNIC